MQFIAVEVFICLLDNKALFVRVRMAIPAYCLNIVGSIFGALFCLLIKKLILECKTVWQSMRKFIWAFWSVSKIPHIDKEETFLSWKLHIDMVWIL